MFSTGSIIFLQKAWQAIAGAVTAVLVTRLLTLEEQGYYYVIGSLMSAAVFFDFGLAGLLVQLSAKRSIGLKLLQTGEIVPEGLERSSYLAFVVWCRCWYQRLSILTVPLFFLGILFFISGNSESTVDWIYPWILSVIGMFWSIRCGADLSLIEGFGQVKEVYLIRLAQNVFGVFFSWALLILGLGLFGPGTTVLLNVLVLVVYLRLRYPKFIIKLISPETFSQLDEIWSMQKRVAISSLGKYIFLNVSILIAFYFSGSRAAGQLGLSIVIGNILGSLCASWLTAKIPQLTRKSLTDKNYQSFSIFMKDFRRAFLLMTAGYLFITLALLALEEFELSRRLLPPFEIGLLFVAFIVYHSNDMLTLFFRVYGIEPFAEVSFFSALLGSLFAVITAPLYGVIAIVLSFLCPYLLVCVPIMLRDISKFQNGKVRN